MTAGAIVLLRADSCGMVHYILMPHDKWHTVRFQHDYAIAETTYSN